MEELKPPRLSNQIRSWLADVKVEPTADKPPLPENWGEAGLSAAERLYAWNTLEFLAISAGYDENPANAIPGRARAVLQLRFVVGTRINRLIEAIRAHLHKKGF
jgi:acetylornithine deacetylase/succinyl-diaminopimelate desuccinylase-like protein